MTDIWSFLLQTLTASGVAVLLLAVKSLFRDKLPPRWHFAIWGILGITMLIPTGLHGRYVLFNWPLVVEMLKTMLAGEYTFTRVLLPFPVLPTRMPQTIFDWLFAVYLAGTVFHLVKYAFSISACALFCAGAGKWVRK